MEGMTRPSRIIVTTALERLDVQTWAKKSVREAVSIAPRATKQYSNVSVDPARVDAVLAMLLQEIEAERRILTERGTVQT
jgi:hypothetical protein